MSTEIQAYEAQQIAALEAEVMAPQAADTASRRFMPKLELVADKPMKRGMFYLGTKNGEKVPLGEQVQVVYLDNGQEVRALMGDEDEKPRCAARDGIPYTTPSASPSCATCIYNTWPDNKPYRDSAGMRCRAKRHITVEVLVKTPDGDDALMPAVMVVPPTSLRSERNYRNDIASMGRLTGTTIGSALTTVSSRYQQDATFSYAVMEFKNAGPAKSKLAPPVYLSLLTDKQAFMKAKEQYEAYNDVKAQRDHDQGVAAAEYTAETVAHKADPKPRKSRATGGLSEEEAPGGGVDDELPF